MIGPRIKIARLNHQPRLTQQELAARLQVMGMSIDRAGIAKLETGIRSVTDVEIVLLARALAVSPGWFFEDILTDTEQ